MTGEIDSIRVDPRAENPRWFEGDYPSCIEGQFAAGLWVSAPTGFFVLNVEFTKSAKEQIISSNQRLFGQR